MKTEHTPGPWDYFHDKKDDMISIGESGWDRSNDEQDKSVCGMWAVSNHDRKSLQENIANARLIAAAPDMLEAMEKYVHHLEMFFSSPRVGQPPGLEGLKAAIEKAKGKSQ